MAPKTTIEQSSRQQSTGTASTGAQHTAEAPSGQRKVITSQVAEHSRADRLPSSSLDPERQQLADKVKATFGPKVYELLAKRPSGEQSTQWLAERVVAQAEVNARNSFKQLGDLTDREITKAIHTTLSQIEKNVIVPREGPKANNRGLISNNPEGVAEAILQSVTHPGALQTLQNYYGEVGAQTFVQTVKPALTSPRGEFAWSNSETKWNGEKLQRDLVHQLLMDNQIPLEHRYTSNNPGDIYAIGPELEAKRGRTNAVFSAHREADVAHKEAFLEATLDGHISGARSARERTDILERWTKAAASPATDEAQVWRLTAAVDRARANDPQPAPVSTYIESNKKKDSPADIKAAQQFNPTVAAAMAAKDPVAFQQSRPATVEEIAQLREQLNKTKGSVAAGLTRSVELSKKIGVIEAGGPTGELSRLAKGDRSKLESYQESCKHIEGSLQRIATLCDNLEKATVTSADYQRLLTEFKAAQRDILGQGGLNDHRAKLGNELIAIERRYRLGNEEARNLAALDKLSPEEKRKSLLTLEGTLSAQLEAGTDISHTLKAIRQLDNDPKRLASYLYRLERAGEHKLVASFAQSIADNDALKSSLEQVLAQSVGSLNPAQRQKVEQIQNALAGVDATVKQHAPVATQEADSPTIAA